MTKERLAEIREITWRVHRDINKEAGVMMMELLDELDRKDEEITKMESLLKKWGALKGRDVVEAARKALPDCAYTDRRDRLVSALNRHDAETP